MLKIQNTLISVPDSLDEYNFKSKKNNERQYTFVIVSNKETYKEQEVELLDFIRIYYPCNDVYDNADGIPKVVINVKDKYGRIKMTYFKKKQKKEIEQSNNYTKDKKNYFIEAFYINEKREIISLYLDGQCTIEELESQEYNDEEYCLEFESSNGLVYKDKIPEEDWERLGIF